MASQCGVQDEVHGSEDSITFPQTLFVLPEDVIPDFITNPAYYNDIHVSLPQLTLPIPPTPRPFHTLTYANNPNVNYVNGYPSENYIPFQNDQSKLNIS